MPPPPPDQVSYSFEIVSARLVRPPKRPPDEACLKRCSKAKGKACFCRDRGDGEGDNDTRGSPTVFAETDAAATADAEDDKERIGKEEQRKGERDRGGEGGEGGRSRAHHSLHMGVNDVATLVLEDNEGITYDFYTFQVYLQQYCTGMRFSL